MKIDDYFRAIYTQDVVDVLVNGTPEDVEKVHKAIQERIRKDWGVEE